MNEPTQGFATFGRVVSVDVPSGRACGFERFCVGFPDCRMIGPQFRSRRSRALTCTVMPRHIQAKGFSRDARFYCLNANCRRHELDTSM